MNMCTKKKNRILEMSQSYSSSQSIPKTVRLTAKIIKRCMELWIAIRLTRPFHREEEGFRYVLNIADAPYSVGKQNLASWNSWDDICKGRECGA